MRGNFPTLRLPYRSMVSVVVFVSIISLSSLINLTSANLAYLMEERRLEDNIAASHDQSMWEVPKYRADSGGCTPSVKWDEFDKVNKWYEWEKRVDEKLVKIAKDAKDKQDRMKKLFFSLGEENMWMQYIDGWTHPKGKESFGDFYINDMNKAADYAATQFGKKNWLDITVYTEIHSLAFTSDAKRLEKRNGFRRETSGVYLPLPDKPLGVFHDIQLNGKINYDVNLRKIDNSPAQNKNGPVWKYNSGYLQRWIYVGKSEEEDKKIVQSYFDAAWKSINEAKDIGTKFKAVVLLYHNLENFHCFLDGNGRTNYLVLQSMLCEIGLHPVMLYNLMESALSSVEEEEQRVIEGLFKWEEAYKTGKPSWTIPAIEERSKDCDVAIDQLMGKAKAPAGVVVPDTLVGCTCRDVKTCDTNTKKRGLKWCKTDGKCQYDWDYCAPGRSSDDPTKSAEKPKAKAEEDDDDDMLKSNKSKK